MNRDDVFERLCRFTGNRLKDSRDKKLYRSKGSGGPLFRLMLGVHKISFSRDLMGLYRELTAFSTQTNV